MPSLQTAQVDNYDFGAPAAAAAAAVAAHATLTLTGLPNDGELVVIGTNIGELTLEFDSDSSVAAGHVAIAIGVDAASTAQTAKAAINAAAIGIVATGSAGVLTLTASTPGKAGNSYSTSENAANTTITAFTAGADATASVGVVKFTIKNGGKLHLHFENPVAEANSTISVEFSADDITYVAATSADNLVAINAVTLKPKQSLDYTVLARAGKDKFMRVTASGGNRLSMQVRRAASVGFDIALI